MSPTTEPRDNPSDQLEREIEERVRVEIAVIDAVRKQTRGEQESFLRRLGDHVMSKPLFVSILLSVVGTCLTHHVSSSRERGALERLREVERRDALANFADVHERRASLLSAIARRRICAVAEKSAATQTAPALPSEYCVDIGPQPQEELRSYSQAFLGLPSDGASVRLASAFRGLDVVVEVWDEVCVSKGDAVVPQACVGQLDTDRAIGCAFAMEAAVRRASTPEGLTIAVNQLNRFKPELLRAFSERVGAPEAGGGPLGGCAGS